MPKKFCTKCGAELEPGLAFCTRCGARIDDSDHAAPTGTAVMPSVSQESAPASYQASPQSQLYPQPQQPAKSKTGIIIGICIAAVVIIALIVVFFLLPLFGGPSASSSSTSASSGSSASASSKSASSSSNASSSSGAASTAAPVFTSAQVSSQLPGDQDTADYGAINLTDGRTDTAWNEGAAGDGSGEWIKFSAAAPQHVTSVSIMGGFPKTYRDGSDVYPKNNRPKEITISGNGHTEVFTMADKRDELQTFTLAQPIDTTELTITINSVYKGTKYDECCIAEVKIH